MLRLATNYVVMGMSSSGNQQIMSETTTPTSADVLCGTGNATAKHPGNILFSRTVSEYVDLYVRAESKKEKMKISKAALDELTSSGVRFLKKHPVYQHWYVASEKVGRDKIGHFLRENLPNEISRSRHGWRRQKPAGTNYPRSAVRPNTPLSAVLHDKASSKNAQQRNLSSVWGAKIKDLQDAAVLLAQEGGATTKQFPNLPNEIPELENDRRSQRPACTNYPQPQVREARATTNQFLDLPNYILGSENDRRSQRAAATNYPKSPVRPNTPLSSFLHDSASSKNVQPGSLSSIWSKKLDDLQDAAVLLAQEVRARPNPFSENTANRSPFNSFLHEEKPTPHFVSSDYHEMDASTPPELKTESGKRQKVQTYQMLRQETPASSLAGAEEQKCGPAKCQSTSQKTLPSIGSFSFAISSEVPRGVDLVLSQFSWRSRLHDHDSSDVDLRGGGDDIFDDSLLAKCLDW